MHRFATGALLFAVIGAASAQTDAPSGDSSSLFTTRMENSAILCAPVSLTVPSVAEFTGLTAEDMAGAAKCAAQMDPLVHESYKKSLAESPALKPELQRSFSAWLSVMELFRGDDYGENLFAEWRSRYAALQSADNDLRAAKAAQ